MSAPSPRMARNVLGVSFGRNKAFLPVLVSAILVSGVVRIPALRAGFALDDFAHLAIARGIFPLHRAPWDLFSFIKSAGDVTSGVRTGALPWWTDPNLRLAFFRPISSLLATFDGRVFGPNAALHHAHSFLWLALLIAGAGALFHRILPARAAALATFVYAVEEGMTTPLAWVANRSAFVSSAFAVSALVFWLSRAPRDERERSQTRRSEEGTLSASAVASPSDEPMGEGDARVQRRDRILTELFTVLAILGGEYGLGVLFLRGGLLLAERSIPLRRRILGCGGLAFAMAVYAVLHRALGYGVAAFPLYRDPTGDRAGYVRWVLAQVTSLSQDLVLGIPAPLPTRPLTALAAAIAFVLVARAAYRRGGDSASLRAIALAVAGVLSLVPLASSAAHTRLLILPALGMSAVVGLALDRSLTRLRSRRVALQLAGLAMLVAAGWVHLPWAAWRSFSEGGPRSWWAPSTGDRNQARLDAMLRVPLGESDHAILIAASDATTILYLREVRALYGHPAPREVRILSANATASRIYRIDDRTLDLELPRSGLLMAPIAAINRGPTAAPLSIGTVVDAGDMTATIVDVGNYGPSRIRYRFDRSLDDPTMKFMVLRAQGFESVAIPAVGSQAGVPPPADPADGPLGGANRP